MAERVDAEFLIEPFTEGEIGAHVKAGIDAVEATGCIVEMGPFGNTVSGERGEVGRALADMVDAAMDAGAERVSVTVVPAGESPPSRRPMGLRDALDRIISSIELELGGSLEELSRRDKQAAVRLLDESGAFLLRRSIEDVAERMGVSRITIYNYLNAIRG